MKPKEGGAGISDVYQFYLFIYFASTSAHVASQLESEVMAGGAGVIFLTLSLSPVASEAISRLVVSELS